MFEALLTAAFKREAGIRDAESNQLSGSREWTSTTAEFSISSELRSSRGHVRRAMLTVRTLMSLLYTSPGMKKTTEGFHVSKELLCFSSPLGLPKIF